MNAACKVHLKSDEIDDKKSETIEYITGNKWIENIQGASDCTRFCYPSTSTIKNVKTTAITVERSPSFKTRVYVYSALSPLFTLLASAAEVVTGAPFFHSDLAIRRARHRNRLPAHNVMAETVAGSGQLVHTFGTSASCLRHCPHACVAQELEDMAMMQRWICIDKAQNVPNLPSAPAGAIGTSYNNNHLIYASNTDATTDEIFPFSSQLLLIIVPLGILTLILIFIIWCRKCSKTSL